MYKPNRNDYVKWKNGIEGWVYFKCPEYITIEIMVKEKPDNLVKFHKKTHILILCYEHQWNELTFIKKRKTIYEVPSNLSTG